MLGAPAAWVEYATPGHLLGEAVHQTVAGFQRDAVAEPVDVILENHGLITSAATGREAIVRSERILDAGRRFFGSLPGDAFGSEAAKPRTSQWAADLRRALDDSGRTCAVVTGRFQKLNQVAQNPETDLSPLVPDDVVCSGPSVPVAGACQSAEAFLVQNKGLTANSTAILVAGSGFVFLAASAAMAEAMEEQLLANVLVRELIARRGTCRCLAPGAVAELTGMESEKHRREVLTAGGNPCRS
jgi:rhamnose utilization protein RhaD (predicted bifunctional aldolase and dehydrogenase)